MEETNKGGRPTIYTEELANTICKRIAMGESLRAICREEDMPNGQTIYNWLVEPEKRWFLEQYTQARGIQAELMFEQLNELADVSVEDIVGDDKSDGARVQARKLQVDTRKWVLSKMLPKKYGDKLDVTSGNKPIPLLNAIRNNDGNKEDSETKEEN